MSTTLNRLGIKLSGVIQYEVTFQILENMAPWMPKFKKYTILDDKIRSILAIFGVG